MISLLYHSHTVVPAHLAELEALGLIEPDEQILVALDGVLFDAANQRLGGHTPHDYCLISTLRIILWARDYGQHLFLAFPLAELTNLSGAGVDPLHAQLQLTFTAPDEDEQRFTLALLPIASLHAALALLQTASTSARALADHGVDAREAGPEILSVIGEQIYGHVDGLRPGESPYRYPGATVSQPYVGLSPAFAQDPASLPPGQVYTAGRLARSAWDTIRRSIREADLPLPFELNGGSIRELTEAVRAINDLVQTVASNPSAQQMAMAFLNRQGGAGAAAPMSPFPSADPGTDPLPMSSPRPTAAPAPDPAPPPSYHEIPLRRRGAPAPTPPPVASSPAVSPRPAPPAPAPVAPPATMPDRRDIPLRRRNHAAAAHPFTATHQPAVVSGSGDAGSEDRSVPPDDRHL
ncbi:MAG: hypothetical protein AB4911_01670 [Oscillochloridaceae bacterium umkhey_bin13]